MAFQFIDEDLDFKNLQFTPQEIRAQRSSHRNSSTSTPTGSNSSSHLRMLRRLSHCRGDDKIEEDDGDFMMGRRGRPIFEDDLDYKGQRYTVEELEQGHRVSRQDGHTPEDGMRDLPVLTAFVPLR